MTAKSGSHPQYGQCPCRHCEKSTRWASESAHRARKGRIESRRTWSRLGGDPAGVRSVGSVRVDARGREIPLRHERLELVAGTGESDDRLVLGALERLVALERIGRLAQGQPKV